MNNFILSYNPMAQFPSEGQLITLLRINRHVLQYHQPFVGTYLLKSYDTAYVLNESFKGIFEHVPYMLTQVNSAFASGSLPQDVWNWLNFGTVPPPPPPTTLPPQVKSLGSAVLDALRNGEK